MSVNIVNESVCNICVEVDVVNVAYFSQLYIIYVLSDCNNYINILFFLNWTH